MGVIKTICVSEKRGTQKIPVEKAKLIRDYGIEGDAHAGNWHRQVSLLPARRLEAFRAGSTMMIPDGAFGENIVVDGLDVSSLPVGTRLQAGGGILEITQIGKECHDRCRIYETMGDCIMPRSGVFARVLEGAAIKPGSVVEVLSVPEDSPFRAAVITLSDRAFAGERKDLSGPTVAQQLMDSGYAVMDMMLLPDDEEQLYHALCTLSDERTADLIVTTGGTGFAARDRTPEATARAAERDAPGIAEAIRTNSIQFTPHAMLSRARSVIRSATLIINLPGSPKACIECVDFVLPVLPHALKLLRGQISDCAR